ncbi:MAG: type II toxin-antitoxin system VapC family toxin [Candidatus Hydrogenedentes bacterium]|nr:type II toxin-antitoxin system VapC family toxin [Candidatus Hydrogenedentota bacterium]
MNTVFADSYYYLALLNPRDAAHAMAVDISRSLRSKVITTGFVMIEIGDAMGKAHQRAHFLTLLQKLLTDPEVTVLPPTGDLYEAGIRLYRSRPDKDWSLTDCISFDIMERFGLKDALTGDQHFQQAGYQALLL